MGAAVIFFPTLYLTLPDFTSIRLPGNTFRRKKQILTDYLDGVPAGGIFVFSFKDYLAVSQIQRENCPRICIPNPGQCDVAI